MLLSSSESRLGTSESTTLRSKELGGSTSKSASNSSSFVQNIHSSIDLQSSDQDSSIYLAVICHKRRLAAAYYALDTLELFLIPDVTENDDYHVLKSLLVQLSPDYVIVSTKEDEKTFQTIQTYANQNGKSPETFIQSLPNIDFALELCKRRLLAVNLPSIPKSYTESERSLFMSSIIPLDSATNMVRAAGALIRYLEKSRVGIELEQRETHVPFSAIRTISHEGFMMVDEATFKSLQIFHRDMHPSAAKCYGKGSKEGLSIYGMINRCKTAFGSKLLRLWLLRPTMDKTVLTERLDAIEYISAHSNDEVTASLAECLKHVKNVKTILGRMIKSEARINDWPSLHKTMYNCMHVGNMCRSLPQRIKIFSKITKTFSNNIDQIGWLIGKVADFEQSRVQNRFVVNPGIDNELDEKKRLYAGLPDLLTEVAKVELASLDPQIVSSCNVVYLQQLGFLLSFPRAQTMVNETDFELPGLEFVVSISWYHLVSSWHLVIIRHLIVTVFLRHMHSSQWLDLVNQEFVSNDVLHYRTARTRELDCQIGDTLCDIIDRESSIMHRLQNSIIQHSEELFRILECSAELDCLISMATCARELSYVRPQLTENNIIQISEGRHPLQELCVASFVSNDTLSASSDIIEGGTKVKLITSPNASGKSVYLKQVALIVYLTHIGSFVPAQSATIGPVDKIFTRISTSETVSVALSTFAIDLFQVTYAVNNATGKSLVILDEFGKGTTTSNGIALLVACLIYWLNKGIDCPHILASTHFRQIFDLNLLADYAETLCCQTMQTLTENDEIVFLYRLISGVSQDSCAYQVAMECGIPKKVLERAKEISQLRSEGKTIARLDDSTSSEEHLAKSVRLVGRFLDIDLDNDNELTNFIKENLAPLPKQSN